MRLVKLLGAFGLVLSMAVGCGDSGSNNLADQGDVNPAGLHNKFVVNSVSLPESLAEADTFGLDLDGDDRPDNQLGGILAALKSAAGESFDIKTQIDQAIAEGDVLILADVQATALATAPGAGMWMFLGDSPTPDPCVDADDPTCGRHLDGTGTFDIAAASPTDAVIVGQIIGGRFNGGPGQVTLELAFLEGSAPLSFTLYGARSEVNVTPTALSDGKLAGALAQEDIDNELLPAIGGVVQESVAKDCQGTPGACCEDGSTGQTILDLFDAEPKDCKVSVEEIRTSSLVSSLLKPDVDFFDCPDGETSLSLCTFSPNKDGVDDSLSLGLAFTAITGIYDLPVGLVTEP